MPQVGRPEGRCIPGADRPELAHARPDPPDPAQVQDEGPLMPWWGWLGAGMVVGAVLVVIGVVAILVHAFKGFTW